MKNCSKKTDLLIDLPSPIKKSTQQTPPNWHYGAVEEIRKKNIYKKEGNKTTLDCITHLVPRESDWLTATTTLFLVKTRQHFHRRRRRPRWDHNRRYFYWTPKEEEDGRQTNVAQNWQRFFYANWLASTGSRFEIDNDDVVVCQLVIFGEA